MLAVSIKHLLGAPIGSVSKQQVEVEPDASFFIEEDAGLVALAAPLTAEVAVLKIDGGFQVTLQDLTGTFEVECHTCLQPYTEEVVIETSNSVFFALRGSAEEADFFVDMAKARLELGEWVRQEILMALPIMQKCSRPACIMPTVPDQKGESPFAGLKDMFQ